MEQNWTEAIPAFLLAKWEITQEVLTWIEEHHSQRLKEDPLYKKLVRHVLQLKDHLAVEQEVDNHIQTLFRILAIQYEDGKEEKDFDAAIRIILHVKAIQTILQDKAFNFYDRLQQLMRNPSTKQQKEENFLPVSKQERMELIDNLFDYTYNTISDEPLLLSLPVRATSTC